MYRKKNNVIALDTYLRERKDVQFSEKNNMPTNDQPASGEDLDDYVPRNPFVSMAPFYDQAVEYLIKKKMEEKRKREATETQIEKD